MENTSLIILIEPSTEPTDSDLEKVTGFVPKNSLSNTGFEGLPTQAVHEAVHERCSGRLHSDETTAQVPGKLSTESKLEGSSITCLDNLQENLPLHKQTITIDRATELTSKATGKFGFIKQKIVILIIFRILPFIKIQT